MTRRCNTTPTRAHSILHAHLYLCGPMYFCMCICECECNRFALTCAVIFRIYAAQWSFSRTMCKWVCVWMWACVVSASNFAIQQQVLSAIFHHNNDIWCNSTGPHVKLHLLCSRLSSPPFTQQAYLSFQNRTACSSISSLTCLNDDLKA